MKRVILKWAEELTRSTILANIGKIEKDIGELNLSVGKSGGALRVYKITGIVSGLLPIIDFITLNNEVVLTNAYVLAHMKTLNDTQRDILISLQNALITNIGIDTNRITTGDGQAELLSQHLILGYSRIKAVAENERKSDKDISIIKENPLLISIFILSIYKDAIFSVVLKVVEEIFRRE